MANAKTPSGLAAIPPLLLPDQRSQAFSNYIASDLAALELHRAVREPTALLVLGIGRSHFWALQSPTSKAFDPDFPRRFKLGNSKRSPTAWWLHELVAWIAYRADMSWLNEVGGH